MSNPSAWLVHAPYEVECAKNEADAVLTQAMEFACQSQPDRFAGLDRNMLIAQHVKIQLTCLRIKAQSGDVSLMKTVQPWHHDRD